MQEQLFIVPPTVKPTTRNLKRCREIARQIDCGLDHVQAWIYDLAQGERIVFAYEPAAANYMPALITAALIEAGLMPKAAGPASKSAHRQ